MFQTTCGQMWNALFTTFTLPTVTDDLDRAAVGQVCRSVRTITIELNDLWPTYLALRFNLTLHRSDLKVKVKVIEWKILLYGYGCTLRRDIFWLFIEFPCVEVVGAIPSEGGLVIQTYDCLSMIDCISSDSRDVELDRCNSLSRTAGAHQREWPDVRDDATDAGEISGHTARLRRTRLLLRFGRRRIFLWPRSNSVSLCARLLPVCVCILQYSLCSVGTGSLAS